MLTFIRHLDALGAGLGLQGGLDSGVHVRHIVALLQGRQACGLQQEGDQEGEEDGGGGERHHSFGRGREREGELLGRLLVRE